MPNKKNNANPVRKAGAAMRVDKSAPRPAAPKPAAPKPAAPSHPDQGSRPRLKDTFKKIISAGSPSDISKEFLQMAAGQMSKTKDDVTARVTEEILSVIRKIDFVKEISKFAVDHKFKISAEIEVFKKEK